MSDTTINIVYLLIVILAPVIPAVLLFFIKGMKSSAEASGPLKGLAIKVGGAFAGYFIVFFVLFFKLPNEFAPAKKNDWRIRATLKDEDGEPLHESAMPVIKLKPIDKAVQNCVVDISLPHKVKNENDIDYKLWIEDESTLYASSKKFDLQDSALKFRGSRIIELGIIKLNLVKKDEVPIPDSSYKKDTLNN